MIIKPDASKMARGTVLVQEEKLMENIRYYRDIFDQQNKNCVTNNGIGDTTFLKMISI
jgi:hypothetical protein